MLRRYLFKPGETALVFIDDFIVATELLILSYSLCDLVVHRSYVLIWEALPGELKSLQCSYCHSLKYLSHSRL